MKGRLTLIKAGVLESLQFRLSMLLTVVGNLLYLLLVYFLWKAVFASTETGIVNGMNFSDTMIYLVFASSLFSFMEMWIVWNMGDDIQSGRIVIDLLKPMKYNSLTFFRGCGEVVVKFFTTFLPTAVIVYFVSGRAIHLGINLLFFVVSVLLSMLVNFYINFMVGTICMHTESIWGVNVMKEVVVGILSGATIPIAFFPETLRQVAMFLPFQAICNSPLQLLLNPEYSYAKCFNILGVQAAWLVAVYVMARLFFRASLKRITVNGG